MTNDLPTRRIRLTSGEQDGSHPVWSNPIDQLTRFEAHRSIGCFVLNSGTRYLTGTCRNQAQHQYREEHE